jgi:GPH family glycoside/pentoside/hexuronide:cation symporter
MLKMSTKILYGLGDLGLSITYFTLGFFFLYFMTDILHLPPALAGLAYFIGQAWDSVNDPFIGALNDRVRSIHGRKRLYLLLGALPFALSFILIWQVPQAASDAVKFTFVTVALLFYTTFYSMIVVPYFALVPIITRTMMNAHRSPHPFHARRWEADSPSYQEAQMNSQPCAW